MMLKFKWVLILMLVSSMVLAACGGDSDNGDDTDSTDNAPVATEEVATEDDTSAATEAVATEDDVAAATEAVATEDDAAAATEDDVAAATEDDVAAATEEVAVTASGDLITYDAGTFTVTMSSVDGMWEIWQEGVRSADTAVILTIGINQLTEETFPEVNDGDMERFLFMQAGDTFSEINGVEYFVAEETDTIYRIDVVIDERTALNVTMNRIIPNDLAPYIEALLAAVPTFEVTINE